MDCRSIPEYESNLAKAINEKFPFLRSQTSAYAAEILISQKSNELWGLSEGFTIPEAETLSQLEDSASAQSWLASRAGVKRSPHDA